MWIGASKRNSRNKSYQIAPSSLGEKYLSGSYRLEFLAIHWLILPKTPQASYETPLVG
jgi:hypothetical protein